MIKVSNKGINYKKFETINTSFNEISRIIPYVWSQGISSKVAPQITPLNQARTPRIKHTVINRSLQLLQKVTTWKRYIWLYPDQGLDGGGELDFNQCFDFWYIDIVLFSVIAATYSEWGGAETVLISDKITYKKRSKRRINATHFYNYESNLSKNVPNTLKQLDQSQYIWYFNYLKKLT